MKETNDDILGLVAEHSQIVKEEYRKTLVDLSLESNDILKHELVYKLAQIARPTPKEISDYLRGEIEAKRYCAADVAAYLSDAEELFKTEVESMDEDIKEIHRRYWKESRNYSQFH